MPVGTQRLRAGISAGTRGIHYQPPNGKVTFLAHEPKAGARPTVLLQVRAG